MWQTIDTGSDPITGCLWPIIDTCDCTTPFSVEVAEAADQMAVGILHAASGRQFGVCGKTIRPCPPNCQTGSSYLTAFDPAVVYLSATAAQAFYSPWRWARVQCGSCTQRKCSCSDVSQIVLPNHNIRQVTDVTIDGVTLDPSAYRLSGRRLIRTDGESWPECQDDAVDAGEVGSWTVSYSYGKAVPAGGQIAAGVYACEIAKSLRGDNCELPQRVQTVTRQGVTIGFVDPMDFIAEGMTGLYVVDTWIRAVNPSGLRRAPGMVRADAT